MKTYTPPPSKSMTHRAMIILSRFADEIKIENESICDDTLATKKAIETISKSKVYCKDSASTLRLMMPQAFNYDSSCVFDGTDALAKRPLDAYFEFFDENNIEYEILSDKEDRFLPLRVKGSLECGNYKISVEKSSQFASALLLYLGGKEGDSEIELTGKIESFDYVNMTASMMNYFGRKVEIIDNIVKISGGKYQNKDILIEADYSQASYFIALGLLKDGLKIKNLSQNSTQADRRIIDIVRKMNGKINFDDKNELLIVEKSDLKACDVDVSECPDLAPTVALLLSLAKGKSTITGCRRLVYKETDRLNNTCKEFNKLGAKISVNGDTMYIEGVEKFNSAKTYSHGDHRLAMVLSIADAISDCEISVTNTACVTKSYPSFFEDLDSILLS